MDTCPCPSLPLLAFCLAPPQTPPSKLQSNLARSLGFACATATAQLQELTHPMPSCSPDLQVSAAS